MRSVLLAALLLGGCEYSYTKPGTRDAGPTAPPPAPSASATPFDPNGRHDVGGQERPGGLAIDADSIFFTTNWDLRGVRRLPRSGGPSTAATTVCKLDDRFQAFDRIVLTDKRVYTLTTATGAGALYRIAKSAVDAPCEKVADIKTTWNKDILRIGNRVLVVVTSDKGSTITSFDESGTGAIAVLPFDTDSMTTDGTNLYLADVGGTPNIYKLPVTGGTPVKIGVGGKKLRFHGGRLYFVKGSAVESIAVESAPPGAPSTVDATSDIVVVGDTLFFGQHMARVGARVTKKPAIGPSIGEASAGSFTDNYVGLAGDAKDVYVATSRNIVRLPPK